MDAFDVLEVREWPRRWRRAFLLTLPVSGPLWAAYLALMLVLCILMWAFRGIIIWAYEMWAGTEEQQAAERFEEERRPREW